MDQIINAIDLSGWGAFTPTVSAALNKVAADSGQSAAAHYNLADAAPDIVSLVNENASVFAKDRGAELVGKKWVDGELVDNPDAKWAITDGTREYMRADVQQAIDEGYSTDQLAETLSDNYAFSDERADVVARTELARAHVEGQMSAYTEAGADKKQWLLSPDACPICQDNADAGTIDFNEDFPSGDDAPPAHPNCTCDVIPIFSQSDDATDNDTEE